MHTNVLEVFRQSHVIITLVILRIDLDTTKVGNKHMTNLISPYRLKAQEHCFYRRSSY